MRARVWAVFVIVQAVAALGYWGHVYFVGSRLGLALWVVGFVGLLPGNLIASEFVGRLLWPTPLSVGALDTIKFTLSVLLNAGSLALVLFVLLRVRAQGKRGPRAPS